MPSKRKAAFLLFYVCVILLMLFTYFYIQKNFSHEVTRGLSGLILQNEKSPVLSVIPFENSAEIM
ncbi:hypothetical protein ACFL6P_08940 [Candidatus Latescibacterota bacterium]